MKTEIILKHPNSTYCARRQFGVARWKFCKILELNIVIKLHLIHARVKTISVVINQLIIIMDFTFDIERSCNE